MIQNIKDETLRNNLTNMIDKIPNMSKEDIEGEVEFYTEQKETEEKNTDLYNAYTIYIEEMKKYIKCNTITKVETEEANTIDEEVEAEDYDTLDYDEEDENDTINFDYDMLMPTHEKIRNNDIEEKGRGRKRNRNDIYKNTSVALACGKVVDNMDGEFAKVLYEKDIDDRLEQLKNEGVTKLPKKSRLIKDLTLVSNQLGAEFVNIVNTKENGLCYIIKQSYNGKYFAPIPLYKWKELVVSTNKELLRLYMVISMHKDISTEKYVLMTLEYLCKCMNIEPTEGNKKYISTATNSLFKLGMIDIEQEDRIEFEDGQRKNKTYNFYRLTTYEEYQAKGKKKKRKRS